MALHFLKYPYRKFLLPTVRKLTWINPDLISYTAVLVAFATSYCYLNATGNASLLIVSIILTITRMTLNTMDGVIAIQRGNLRIKGQVVNALPDRYADIAVVGGIALSGLCSPFIGLLGLSSMFLVSYTGMLGKALGDTWQQHGPLDKVERLVYIMIFSLLQYLSLTGKIEQLYSFTYFEWLMILFIAFGQITVLRRLIAQLKEYKEIEERSKDFDVVNTNKDGAQ